MNGALFTPAASSTKASDIVARLHAQADLLRDRPMEAEPEEIARLQDSLVAANTTIEVQAAQIRALKQQVSQLYDLLSAKTVAVENHSTQEYIERLETSVKDLQGRLLHRAASTALIQPAAPAPASAPQILDAGAATSDMALVTVDAQKVQSAAAAAAPAAAAVPQLRMKFVPEVDNSDKASVVSTASSRRIVRGGGTKRLEPSPKDAPVDLASRPPFVVCSAGSAHGIQSREKGKLIFPKTVEAVVRVAPAVLHVDLQDDEEEGEAGSRQRTR